MTAPSAGDITHACEFLSQQDQALARAYETCGPPIWRSNPPSYALLARLITYQLISTKAAAAIWARVTDQFGANLQPATILTADLDRVRACGLTGAKVRSLHAIAEALTSGTLDLDRVCNAAMPLARKELTAIRGIGPWTAEVFILYATGAMDAFPTGDVGLMEAHSQLGEYTPRKTSQDFSAYADLWRPYRGVAAHLLWAWLNHMRSLPQTT